MKGYSLRLSIATLLISMSAWLSSCTLEQLQALDDGKYLQVGLQSLLRVSTDTSVKNLSVTNGYFGDQLVKILLPPEAQDLQRALQYLGQQQLVDDMVLKMNRAAEKAATKATPIFTNAILGITFSDAFNIVNGANDTAATAYLRRTTSTPLFRAFQPQIDTVLAQPLVGTLSAKDSWVTIIGLYDQVRNLPFNPLNLQPINADLSAFVTQKALDGLYVKIKGHEQKVRKDLNLRVTPEIRRLWQQ